VVSLLSVSRASLHPGSRILTARTTQSHRAGSFNRGPPTSGFHLCPRTTVAGRAAAIPQRTQCRDHPERKR